MNFHTYHFDIQKVISFRNLLPKISKALGENFSPIFHEAVRWSKEQLAYVGIEIPIPIYHEDLEVFVNKETNHMLAFRLNMLRPKKSVLDILEFYAGNKKQEIIIESLEKAIGFNINEGSFLETALLNKVQKRLGKLSPNGKILADTSLRKKIRRLYNDSDRLKMIEIMSTYGENVVTLGSIVNLLKENKDSVKKFCSDSDLFVKRYLILCNECGAAHLSFSAKSKANKALADSNNYCASCGEKGKLEIVESFEIVKAVRLGIQQGLWLESLASDIISEFTNQIWIGQMVDTNELDVLSIFCDKRVLIECKDTSFGQNDFYVTAMKAQDIGADIVIVIVTRDIHPNVQSIIDRYNREGERTFTLLIETSSEKIKSSLMETLKGIQDKYITEWFYGERYFAPFGFVRRFPRRYR